jgi:hypothetical protein
VQNLPRALEAAGVRFIEADEQDGVGVRLAHDQEELRAVETAGPQSTVGHDPPEQRNAA